MCDPISLGVASLIIGVGSTGASYMQTTAAQKAQNEYQTAQSAAYAEAANQNITAANLEYTEKMAAERIQEMQEKATASADTIASNKEVMQKKGTMMASTAAGGNALTMLMADYDREQAVNANAILEQYNMNKVAHETNINSYKISAQNTVNTQQGYVVSNSGSSSLGTALGLVSSLGSSGLSAYNTYNNYSG